MIDIGSVIGNKYRLVRLVGEGGMGAVYEAEHMALGSRVAIKVLHPELARREGLVERFLQEARVAAQIRSPHVVRVADVDRTPEGQAYIVMDLLEGEPLSAVLAREHRLPLATACEYAEQILDALEAAHALGVIHRDLKPENVFVTREGGKPVLKLIDFGIAKARRGETQKNLTVAGALMGTAEYMAPEQARSAGAVDVRADLYSVGVMLYEMIAGARPVTGEDARVIAYKVERGEVVPLRHAAPDAPREIAGLVHHAMAPRAEMRFASAMEMRAALRDARAGKNAPPPAETPVHTLRAMPIAPALTPMGGATMLTPVGAPAATGTAPGAEVKAPHRRGRGTLAAVVALVLLAGGGAAVALVQSGVFGQGSASVPSPAEPGGASAPASEATASGVAPATGPAAVPTAVPTLQPAKPAGFPSRPAAGFTGDSGFTPAPTAPPGFPTALPPFPSSFPFPTSLPSGLPPGFPTSLPSTLPPGFPTSLPSGFPTVLPQWPFPPQPTAAPSASGAGPTI